MSKTLDLFAFTGAKKTGQHQLVEALFTNGGSVCTGIQKLIQDWILLMLTPKGSLPFDPERGCSFLEEALGARTEEAVRVAFVFANADVIQQLRNMEEGEQNDDERIDSVTLDSINIIGGTISVSVTLTSMAGDSREVQLPITSNPVIL